MANSISLSTHATSVVENPSDKPKTVEGAAKQFEALLIGQILKSAQESSSDGFGDEKDSSGDSMLDLANQQFSQLLANNGGLGLTKMILKGLQK